MDLASKIMGFQFEPERGISNHEGFYQDRSDDDNSTERDMLSGKIATLVFHCTTKKAEKECLFFQEVEAVRDFNLRGIFVLSQAIISELTHNLMISISLCFSNQTWFQKPCYV